MAWDFSTDAEYEAKLDWARAFVREEIYPIETIADEVDQATLDRIYAPLMAETRRQGLWACHLPPELGGQGFGQVKLALLNEILGASFYAAPAFGCQAPDSGNSEILALAGTAAQKQRYLFPLLDGKLKSAFLMTERESAGSDPTLLRTRATRVGEDWVIEGEKWFASNASVADFCIVVAVTDPEAPPHRRATMFIVDAGLPGLEILRDIGTMDDPRVQFGRLGGHAEVRLEEVRVGADAVLGTPGGAFVIAQQRLGPGRIHHCMRWLGAARRAFDMLCERSVSRYAHGSTLGEKQTVQNWIADSAAELTAARLMTMQAAWKMDALGAKAARQEIALIKFHGASILHNVIDRALQAHGSLGFSTDLPLEQMYRHARAARIYDGPDEVHRQSVARQILKGVEPAADGVPSEHVPTRRAAARKRLAGLLGDEFARRGDVG